MKVNELKEIVNLIEQSKIELFRLEKGDFKLHYQKEGAKELVLNDETVVLDKDLTKKDVKEEYTAKTDNEYYKITSPMIGSFHSRPNPDAEPFVQVGSTIYEGDPVCGLEAMKLLNEVHSNVTGEIIGILVEDGEIVEYGQPLFTVKVSD